MSNRLNRLKITFIENIYDESGYRKDDFSVSQR